MVDRKVSAQKGGRYDDDDDDGNSESIEGNDGTNSGRYSTVPPPLFSVVEVAAVATSPLGDTKNGNSVSTVSKKLSCVAV